HMHAHPCAVHTQLRAQQTEREGVPPVSTCVSVTPCYLHTHSHSASDTLTHTHKCTYSDTHTHTHSHTEESVAELHTHTHTGESSAEQLTHTQTSCPHVLWRERKPPVTFELPTPGPQNIPLLLFLTQNNTDNTHSNS